MASATGRARCSFRDRVRAVSIAIVVALVAFCAGSLLVTEPAPAQNLLRFPPRPPAPTPPEQPADAPMLVQASEIRYDYTGNTISAVGNVQLYYKGSTVEADEVTYDQKSKRLQARGNVRITEPDGKITYGQFVDLTQDYRDGFVDSLRLETYDDTRFAAVRADRVRGNYTVMQNGVYTACLPCRDNPKKPPLWQVRAARIIHDNTEKMIYFEDARVEFFGYPLLYFPFLSSPDPTVTRKSGFLYPTLTYSSVYGGGFEVPYFWAIAPDKDLTVSARVTTKEGELFQATWRQRLINGSYSIKAAGIFQTDPGFFASRDGPDSPTANSFRGAIETAGQFALSDKWVWGWTGLLMTDKFFLYDYQLGSFLSSFDPFHTGIATEGVSQLYLTGAGERSYFDVRTIYYYGFSGFDIQAQIPWIRPVLDYSNVLPQPVLGGELSYAVNVTSLTRQQAEFDAVNQNAANNLLCASTNSPQVLTPANCLLRGVAGTYTRASAEVDWRRTFVTDNGQMITPFAGVRGDIAQVDIQNQPGISNFINPGESELTRAMPDIGVEYRYPFIDVEPWGTQTLEPIAQLVLRPNETEIGKFPNEDAQSVAFSDSNLFSIDKFSGWDRVEGGSRLNAGLQYTAQVNNAGAFNVLFGQSYQLFGLNSYSATDLTNTGLDSGLDKTFSDYVAGITYQPNQVFTFTAHGRFSSGGFEPGIGDVATFTPERLEFETRANFDRWTFQLFYGDYAPQPEIGYVFRRDEVLAGAAYKITQNWVVLGSVRYDIVVNQFDQTRFGIGYTDDCLLLSLNYITSFIYTGVTPTPNNMFGGAVAASGTPTPNNMFMFQFSLRTLGPEYLAPIASVF